MAWGESWMTRLGAFCRGGRWELWWMGRSQPSPLMCYLVCHREQYWAPYYSLCILMTSLIKCPQVPSVDYLQMTAYYTIPYTHWRTSPSCSMILMHFRGGPSCGVCGSIWRSATSCTFAELSLPKCPIFYELWDTVLLSVTDSKYLGIRLSEDLGWGVQVDAACKKANTKLHFVQQNLKSAPKRARELAFQGLVRSGLEYCSTLWDPTTNVTSTGWRW